MLRMRKVSSQQPFTISSETVEEITNEDDDDEEDVKNKERQKLQNLKRKLLPSRKSPRIKIPKLDLKKGVKTALPSQHQDIVESLAKEAMKKFKGQKPEVPLSKQKQGQPSSSSSSSHVSGKQRSVLEMYAQAVWQIAHPSPGLWFSEASSSSCSSCWSDNAETEEASVCCCLLHLLLCLSPCQSCSPCISASWSSCSSLDNTETCSSSSDNAGRP